MSNNRGRKRNLNLSLISDRITYVRRLRGTSQEKLAEKLGIYAEEVSRYETGVHKPNIEMAADIIKILGANPDYILFGEGEPLVDKTTP